MTALISLLTSERFFSLSAFSALSPACHTFLSVCLFCITPFLTVSPSVPFCYLLVCMYARSPGFILRCCCVAAVHLPLSSKNCVIPCSARPGVNGWSKLVWSNAEQSAVAKKKSKTKSQMVTCLLASSENYLKYIDNAILSATSALKVPKFNNFHITGSRTSTGTFWALWAFSCVLPACQSVSERNRGPDIWQTCVSHDAPLIVLTTLRMCFPQTRHFFSVWLITIKTFF